MTFLDTFFRKKDQALPRARNISIHEQYKEKEKKLFTFFEAEDDFEFYRHSIELIYRDFEIIPLLMNGKPNVLNAYKEIDWTKFQQSRVLFFVDKDFDDILGKDIQKGDNLFYTKYYSIENYLVTKEVFRIILDRFFRVTHDTIREALLNEIIESHSRFKENMVALTSLILVYREISAPLNLDKINLSDFFYSYECKVHPKIYLTQKKFKRIMRSEIGRREKSGYTSRKKLQTVLEKTDASEELAKYKKVIKYLRKIQEIDNAKIFLRGKYELWFLIQIIENLKYTIGQINQEISRRNKKRHDSQKLSIMDSKPGIQEKNIFDVLPPKIQTPEDIKEFLISNYKKIEWIQ